MSQLKIDQFVRKTSTPTADRNDNLNKQVIDLTIDNERSNPSASAPSNRLKSNLHVPCLSTLDELQKRLDGSSLGGNLPAMKKGRRKGRRKPEEHEWFYMFCNENCDADCQHHYFIDSVMSNASEEARKRVRFYREQLKNESKDCPVEYIFGYERVNGHDYYKVKWAGWPKESWKWVHALHIEHEPVDRFRRCMQERLPFSKWPKHHDKNYKVPLGVEIKTPYEIDKDRLRAQLDQVQAHLREKDKTVLVENEEDQGRFPQFDFITAPKHHETAEPQLGHKNLFVCQDQCGFCSASWHWEWEMNWDKQYPKTSKAIQHFVIDEKDGKTPLVRHGSKNIIIECTDGCACVQNGTCTNNALIRLKQNPLPFVIFKCESGKGWGLKCLRPIKKGEPVVEYIGEHMSLREFHRREASQEKTSTMYCVELTRENNNDVPICIDSADSGNHARFINHACGEGASLEIYRMYGAERNPNRPRIVLFARRDIKIGQELTFDYKFVFTEELDEDEDELLGTIEVQAEKRRFDCLCMSRHCPSRQEREKKRKLNQSATLPKSKKRRKSKPAKST